MATILRAMNNFKNLREQKPTTIEALIADELKNATIKLVQLDQKNTFVKEKKDATI